MTLTIPADLSIAGDFVRLEPMTLRHQGELSQAVKDGKLWNLTCTSVPSPETMAETINQALAEKAKGDQFPFVVRRLSDKKIVGSTRYYWIRPQHRNLSIGYTWYAKSAQRTVANTECKLLLLAYAFDQLNCISVALHVDDTNEASKTAVARRDLGPNTKAYCVMIESCLMAALNTRTAFQSLIVSGQASNKVY